MTESTTCARCQSSYHSTASVCPNCGVPADNHWQGDALVREDRTHELPALSRHTKASTDFNPHLARKQVPIAMSSADKKWLIAGVGTAVLLAMVNLVGSIATGAYLIQGLAQGNGGPVTARQVTVPVPPGHRASDFPKSEIQRVAAAVFPGWEIMQSTARAITPTAVTAIAYATDPTQTHGMAAAYIYESREGIGAPGESDTRDLWKANAEEKYGVPYTWLTCRNAMFLEPMEINNWASTNMQELGC